MTNISAILTNPIVERAYKTAIETGIAAAATTPVASTSTLEKVLVTAVATFLSVLWNGIVTAKAARTGSKLTALQAAIDTAVSAKLAAIAPAAPVEPEAPGNAA